MAYYFAVETTQDSFDGLNIKKSKKFKKTLGKTEVTYECTLEEIDAFTTTYNSPDRISYDLYSDSLLPWCHSNNPLSIIYKEGLEVRKVQGGILLEDSKKYIQNPNLVIEYINKRVSESDAIFFRTLSSTLDETSIITFMVSKLATAIEEKIIYDKKTTIEKLKNPLQKQVNDNMMNDIASALVYDCYLDGEGELIFSGELDYEKFHNTVAFISSYEKELEKNKYYTRTKRP